MNKRTRITTRVNKPAMVYSTNKRFSKVLNALYSINKLKTN